LLPATIIVKESGDSSSASGADDEGLTDNTSEETCLITPVMEARKLFLEVYQPTFLLFGCFFFQECFIF
jgi:hypothetical protein